MEGEKRLSPLVAWPASVDGSAGASTMIRASGDQPLPWWHWRPASARRLLERLPAGFWQVASSTSWLMVGHAARLVVGLLVGVYVARYLGPPSYGVLNYAISFVFLFSALAHLGLNDIVVRDLLAHPDRQGETLGSAFVLRLASSALALALIVATAWTTEADPTTRLMILVIAGSVFFEAMSGPAEWFKSKVLARPVVIAGLIGMATASVMRIAFVVLGKPVTWFVWPFLIDTALTAGLALVFYRRYAGPPLAHWRPRIRRMRELAAQSWPLAIAAGLVMIQLRIDQVMLGEMLGPTELGWYAAAARLSQLWNFVPFAIGTAVFPIIARAKQTSPEFYNQRMQSYFDFLLWLGIVISLPATLVADAAVRFLYGDAYAPSASILQIHVWSLVITSIGTAAGAWMIFEGLARVELVFSIVAVLTNILLNVVLIPSYGALGAAWATLAASGPVLLLRFIYRPTRPTSLMMLEALRAPFRPVMRSSRRIVTDHGPAGPQSTNPDFAGTRSRQEPAR
jgi:O-antigen/teichoic acid export membrane protein